jgi:hypothetical protein
MVIITTVNKKGDIVDVMTTQVLVVDEDCNMEFFNMETSNEGVVTKHATGSIVCPFNCKLVIT